MKSIGLAFLFGLVLTAISHDATARTRPLHLISDVDDTIKRTNVLSTSGVIVNGPRTTNAFGAMNVLYNAWACDPHKERAQFERCMKRQAQTHAPSRITTYVTAAPSQLQMISLLFLKNSGFPTGLFIGRELEGSDDRVEFMNSAAQWGPFPKTLEYKIDTIKKLMEDHPDHDFILVGDNGEKDVPAYDAVTKFASKRFPQMQVQAFIHQVYEWNEGVEPAQGQILYATASDLGFEFFKRGWINETSLQRVMTKMVQVYKEDAGDVFPEFLNCRPMTREGRFPQVPDGLSGQTKKLATNVLELVRRYCERGGRD